MAKFTLKTVVAALVLLVTCALGTGTAQQQADEATESPDFAAQKVTCFRIYMGRANVDAFKSSFPGRKLPSALRALDQELEGVDPQGAKWLDGWGRPLTFFVTHDGHYVIASFGKDGLPQGQATVPGGNTAEMNWDADIVLIDGDWAQVPGGVGGLNR